MERIPLLEERLTHLGERISELHLEQKADIQDLKAEHIGDVRKNVCRLWMAFDEMRQAVSKICLSMEGLKAESALRAQFIRTTFIILGSIIGALTTVLATKFYH